MHLSKQLFLLLPFVAFSSMTFAQWSVTPEIGMNVTKYNQATPKMGFKIGSAIAYTFAGRRFTLQSGLYYVGRNRGESSEIWGFSYNKDQDYYHGFQIFGNSLGGYGTNYAGSSSNSFFYNPLDAPIDGISRNTHKQDLGYLQMPILARFNWEITPETKFHLAFGPYLAYGLGGTYFLERIYNGLDQEITYSDFTYNPFERSDIKRFDWGIQLNAGFEIRRFTLDFSYDTSFYWPSDYFGLNGFWKPGTFIPTYHSLSVTIGYKFNFFK